MEKRLRNKHKQQTGTQIWLCGFILLALVLTIIFARSVWTWSYDTVQVDGAAVFQAQEGYEQNGTSFHLTDSENAYLLMGSSVGDEKIVFSFNSPAQENVTITAGYVDTEGNYQSDGEKETVWKKGTRNVVLDSSSWEDGTYLVRIPVDFDINCAYYGVDKVISESGRTLMVLCCILIFGLIIWKMWKKNLFDRMDAAWRSYADQVSEKKKEYLIRGAYGIVAAVAAFVAGYLLLRVKQSVGILNISPRLIVIDLVLAVVFGMMMFCYRVWNRKIELMGALCILLVGSLFSVMEPANVGVSWDDEVHFNQASHLTHIFDRTVSFADQHLISVYADVAENKSYYQKDQQNAYQEMLDTLEREHFRYDQYQYRGNTISMAYIPSALGMAFGRGIGLGHEAVVKLGRWMNLLLLAVLSYLAMKRLKSGKMAVVLIAMIPTNLFIAGNYNYDTWLLGWSILGLSIFFGEWQKPEEKISYQTILFMTVSLFLAVLPKLVYVPIIGIIFFMPWKKFTDKKQRVVFYGCIALAIAMPLIALYIQNLSAGGAGITDSRGLGGDINGVAQIAYIRSNIVTFSKNFLEFLKGYLNPFVNGREYMINQAYLGYIPVSERWILCLVLLGVFFSRKRGEIGFPWWSKLGTLFVYAAIGAIAAMSMYIAFTPVGYSTVLGCQGRYIAPAIFPLLYVWSRIGGLKYKKGKPSMLTRLENNKVVGAIVYPANRDILIMMALAVISMIGLWSGCLSLY